MCGIIGGYVPGGINIKIVEHSLDRMRHRGPDDCGIYQADSLFLGSRRLSIIDLSGGHQPLFNEDGSIAVVLNGEIYNYLELSRFLSASHVLRSRSDTETLPHLYEDYGTNMCRHLRGMFAFAILDSRTRSLFVCRDRFGKKPLYYTLPKPGTLMFASELKALKLLAEGIGAFWSVRDQGIYDYLSLGVIPQPQTIYKNVYTLPAGSWMLFRESKLTIQTYWWLDHIPRNVLPYDEVVENTRSIIGEAVDLRLRSDVPSGVFLSGGIDSSVIVFEASKRAGNTLRTFTVSFDDEHLDETAMAKRTAQFLGVENIVLQLKIDPLNDLYRLVAHYDQPFADSSAIPSLKVSELAREYVKVILTGDGGDELFAGYRRHLAAQWLDRLKLIPLPVIHGLLSSLKFFSPERRSKLGFAVRFLKCLSQEGGTRYLGLTTDMLTEMDKKTVWLREPQCPTEEWIESLLIPGLSVLALQMDADIKINLLSDLLVKMDMATMAASVEARSPFMDHVLAEFVSLQPPHYLLRSGRTKALLRDAYRGLLPEDVIAGPKRGFEVPLNSMLRNDFRPLIMDTLACSSSKVASYISRYFIDALLAGTIMQDRNYGYILYALLVLELWLRQSDSVTIKDN